MYHSVAAAPKKAVSPSSVAEEPEMGPHNPQTMQKRAYGGRTWASAAACAAVLSALFLLVSAHDTYKFTDRLLAPFKIDIAEINGCATGTGLMVHAVVFFLLAMILIKVLGDMKM